MLEKTFPLGQQPPSADANNLNLESGHNILAGVLARFVRKEYGIGLESASFLLLSISF